MADLGSTNETLVNGGTIQESMLRSRDSITIGETTIRVLRSRLAEEEKEPSTGFIVSRPVAESELDLGLAPREEAAAPGQKPARKHVPGFLWIVAAAAVVLALLAVAAKFVHDQQKRTGGGPVETAEVTLPLHFTLEKVSGGSNNIFRSRFELVGNELRAEMRNLRENRQDTRVAQVSDRELAALRQRLEGTEFFEAQPRYETRSTDRYDLVDLSVSIDTRTHRSRVLNQRVVPAEVKGALDIIQAFGEIELETSDWFYPTEDLYRMARLAWESGDKKWRERKVSHHNLWEALKEFQKVKLLLGSLDEKPEFYAQADELLQEGAAELEQLYSDYSFKVEQASRNSQYDVAAEYLRMILQLIPDRADERHIKAQNLLNETELRIPR